MKATESVAGTSRGEAVAAQARPGESPALNLNEVERWFTGQGGQRVHAVGPVSTSIKSGEFVCIVGPSGCGKSTLLKIVAGLTTPTEGTVEIPVDSRRGPPIAMVFQEYGIYPWKTVRSNVQFGLTLAGVGQREARERVDEWLERMHIAEFASAYPHQLSGGMRQRVAIARALAVEPQILLMDEPFAALDAQLREVLQDELLSMWQADRRTVLFVTHSLEEALVLGDRVIVMSGRPGRIVSNVVVPFERPRSGALRNTPEFGELRARLWDLLRGEIETEEAKVQ